MIKVEVSIPDTAMAKEALDKAVLKIVKAHRATALANGDLSPSVNVVKSSEPVSKPKEGDTSALLKDLSINDVKTIIKDNKVKVGVGNGAQPDSFYFELLSQEDGLKGMIDAHKAKSLSEYS